MNLREQVEADLSFTLEDNVSGFGWPVVVTNPNGVWAPFFASTNDVEQLIDPDTGQSVTGRFATVTLRISSLIAAGLGIPQGIVDTSSKPWVVEFEDINGVPYKFKVAKSFPDRGMGVVACALENYE